LHITQRREPWQSQPNTQRHHDTDRIEKRVVLRAPRSRVWRALSNAQEFGTWFRVKLDGAFTPGKPIRGKMAYRGYEHLTIELLIERIDPEHYFSYRWHPYAITPPRLLGRATTLVEFTLADVDGGTELTIGRSGSIASRSPVAPKRSA